MAAGPAIAAKHGGQAAQVGDPLSQTLITEARELVGYTIVSLMSLFNPRIVIIGGGVSLVGELFFDPTRQTGHNNLHRIYWEDCPIVPVTLGDDAGLLGGVALLNSLA